VAEESTAVASAPAPAAAPAASAPAAAPAPAAPAAAPAAAAPAAPAPSAPAAAVADPAAPNADPAKPAADPAKPADPAAPAAPEKYSFVMPKDVVLDAKVVSDFEGVAKELNLSQEAAQKVIDKMGPVIVKNDTARIAAAVEKARADWTAQAAADKEVGGERFAENVATAKKAFDAFGTPELAAVLKASGLDNHPELIRWAYRIGKQLGPDNKFIAGSTKNPEQAGTFEERAAAKLYKF